MIMMNEVLELFKISVLRYIELVAQVSLPAFLKRVTLKQKKDYSRLRGSRATNENQSGS